MSGSDNGRGSEAPLRNPYARDRRVPFNHRVYEGLAQAYHDLSKDLEAAGYPSRQVSIAELSQAVLHFGQPASLEEAGDLLQRWAMVKAAPPVSPDDLSGNGKPACRCSRPRPVTSGDGAMRCSSCGREVAADRSRT